MLNNNTVTVRTCYRPQTIAQTDRLFPYSEPVPEAIGAAGMAALGGGGGAPGVYKMILMADEPALAALRPALEAQALCVCVCVCVCTRARACVCACVCVVFACVAPISPFLAPPASLHQRPPTLTLPSLRQCGGQLIYLAGMTQPADLQLSGGRAARG